MNITVKNIPTVLHRLLKKHAQLHRRSLNSEIIFSLSSAAGLTSVTEDFLSEAQAIRMSIQGHLTDAFINQAKSEGRQ